jgi:hypothetical protein
VSFGFILSELALSGPGKPDARISLKPGLNVVAGPSDTGKTYIFQCLDYAMGGTDPPKPIPEAEGYDMVRLSLEARAGGIHHLARSLRGGDGRVSSDGGDERVLGAKHSADDPNTISAFLLGLSGLSGRRVRRNAAGATRSLSFRDLAHLALVDEESVMTDRSPALSGQYTAATVEKRVFRLLLTGEDDSSLGDSVDPNFVRARRAGEVELLEGLIAQARTDLGDAQTPETIEVAEREAEARRTAAADALAALTAHQEAGTGVEEHRRAVWKDLRRIESRADVLRELDVRFELLEEQYSSDLRRLQAIAEAGARLGQMTEERCPVCGALAEHHDREHAERPAAPEDVKTSSQAESAKIATLVEDLGSTRASNRDELRELEAKQADLAADLRSADDQLAETLRPKVAAAVRAFREAEAERRRAERRLEQRRREHELEELLKERRGLPSPKPTKLPPPEVTAGEAESLARAAEALLRAWHFPDLGRVTFSDADQDLVISGRPRASFGKGVRAITHAAFVLSLLRSSLDAVLPFTGMVVIDSPLVVYREPDVGEGSFPAAVKEHFYISMTQAFKDAQVLILENDAPPASLATEANIVTFTKTASGRYGFIPMRE